MIRVGPIESSLVEIVAKVRSVENSTRCETDLARDFGRGREGTFCGRVERAQTVSLAQRRIGRARMARCRRRWCRAGEGEDPRRGMAGSGRGRFFRRLLTVKSLSPCLLLRFVADLRRSRQEVGAENLATESALIFSSGRSWDRTRRESAQSDPVRGVLVVGTHLDAQNSH